MKLPTAPILLLLANLCILVHSIERQRPILDEIDSSATRSLLSLHKSLVDHESVTGNEHGVAQWLVSYLKDQNFTVETQEVAPATKSYPSRENILAYVGKHRKTRTLVSSHIDVVPPNWPYQRKGGEIWGRGSVDAKGSVAAQITAFEQLLTGGRIEEGDVALLFVVGEEVGGDGMKKANELGLEWETVIFGEPTELKLASGHKGIMSFDIKAKGKAGHSGYPSLGKNANAMLIPALCALQKLELPYSEKYGNSTLNIGVIKGGVAMNVIAENAIAQLSIRVADGNPKDLQKLILDTVKKIDENLEVTFHGGYGPVYIDSDVQGFDIIVVNYGTDIPNLKGDHKRYLYGPGDILVAHSDHEHLTVRDLQTAVAGYKALIEHSLYRQRPCFK